MNGLKCIFSGNDPDTEEHVIPDWLQRRFDLNRQKYHLPNTTYLDYRHAKVPATRFDNEQFGQIEKRISQNQFVWEEIFLWLFKIHIGLIYKDVNLHIDITNPSSQTIIPPHIINHQLKLFRELYRQYFLNSEFSAHRSPPGSVFILPSFSPGYFDFVHSFHCGTVGINIGDFYLATSLWDFGMARDNGYFKFNWNKDQYYLPPSDLEEQERMRFYIQVQRIWLCNLGYWSFRWNINMFKQSHDYQPDMPKFEGPPSQRPENSEELAKICQTFGLKLIEFIPSLRSRFSLSEDGVRNS